MQDPNRLRREVGLGGATLMGLGSMIGTGVFVSIGIAAGVSGPAVILAILIAALVATCNALSSAQLAASHSVSGGTYEYGYRYLNPTLGFTAGWVFLCAKTASAATAALGFAAYALRLAGSGLDMMPLIAVGVILLFTLLVLCGLRRSSIANMLIVAITLLGLGAFLLVGAGSAIAGGSARLTPFFLASGATLFETLFYASALMFVAFAGYARIATLGEEVIEPRKNIPRAIVAALVIAATVYICVALVAIGAVGVEGLRLEPGGQATPLELAARAMGRPLVASLVSVAAITAMLGVLLNLMLGLSRVLLAMGRQGDMPPILSRISKNGSAPAPAVVLVGLLTAGLAAVGSIETAWAFSAFTILIYYAITNLAALRLPAGERLYPRWVSAAGLLACLFLAFWVPVQIWMAGAALIIAGLLWKGLAPRLWK